MEARWARKKNPTGVIHKWHSSSKKACIKSCTVRPLLFQKEENTTDVPRSQLKIFQVHKFILKFTVSHYTSIKHGFMSVTV